MKISSGSILANDGYGTDVTNTLGSASYTLIAALPVELKSSTVETPPETTPASEEESKIIDLNAIQQQNPAPQTKQEKTISLSLPSLEQVKEGYMNIMSFVIPLLALIYFLLYTFMRGAHKIRKTRVGLKRDISQVERLVSKSFMLLRDDVDDSIRMLERAKTRRKLTEEEDAIIERLRQNLSDAEDVINKEVSKIEKEI